MRPLLLTLAVLALTAAPALADRTPHIVGGTDAAEYPAQAEINVDVGLTSELCGGTLIDPQWVLTAAHCVSDLGTAGQRSPEDFTVRLGSNRLGKGAPSTVDSIFRFAEYDPVSFRGDAAVLHLSLPVPQPPLPVVTDATLRAATAGQDGRVLGWGFTSERGFVSDTLRQVDVPIRSAVACDNAYPGTDADLMFCAGPDEGGRDACQGDSGGPLMVATGSGFATAGIVSSGDGCGQPGKFGVYTRLSSSAMRSFLATHVRTVAADQEAAAAALRRKPDVGPSKCSRRSCAVRVAFAAGGAVEARLVVSRAVRRRLDLRARRVSRAAASFPAVADEKVTLTVGGAVRRALRSAGKRSVPATLHVAAQTASGLRTTARRSARLRR